MIVKTSDQVSRFTWLERFPIPRNFNVTPKSRIDLGRTWPAPAGATRTKAFQHLSLRARFRRQSSPRQVLC